MNKELKPLSLYIHIPFCVRKCLYCDFLSFPTEGKKYLGEVKSYVSLLCEEIREYGRILKDRYYIRTVFIGGGTPSIIGEKLLKIDEALCESFDNLSDCIEMSIEVNPGTVDARFTEVLRRMKTNRVSIGLQSANASELKSLGRIHDYEQFLKTYDYVRSAEIHNVNIDIMADIPGQTCESYEETLRKVIHLNPEHISAYSLIVEPGTVFYEMDERGELDIPDEETDRRMYHMTKDILLSAGYKRYEISNYAKDQFNCLHNLAYWDRDEYLGLGLGASSLIKTGFEDYEFRLDNPRSIKEYESYIDGFKSGNSLEFLFDKGFYEDGSKDCNRDSFGDELVERVRLVNEKAQLLNQKEEIEEFFFLGLRKIDGVSLKRFREVFNCDALQIYGDVIKKLVNDGLLEYNSKAEIIKLTEYGTDVSNMVMSEFLIN
ncbi:MAG: radical SAM family heme chaperone HemW [Lachnospiraceae bacterium]|nr:radical SAM family heme chaperone HemW [Lachnospiraceae bacterium]